jgi:8-oxo-dGTP pyrophosphatase MutT (NUDIX family)
MKSTGFDRHVRACNNAVLPGGRLAFLIGDRQVGWVPPGIAGALEHFPGVIRSAASVTLLEAGALPGIARALADRGMYRWRAEAFDVRPAPDETALTTIDRGAIPSFGIQATGVHVNGIVRRPAGLHVWVARRARDKLLDPGKLDHIVAGGVPTGLSPSETLVKEAAEEAAIPADLAGQSVLAGRIAYAMERPEGLRRDNLYCYDLDLPTDFVPVPTDGEVEAFECWPVEQVFAAVRDTDSFKFNVNLVLIDLFIRLGLIAGPEATGLRAWLRQ